MQRWSSSSTIPPTTEQRDPIKKTNIVKFCKRPLSVVSFIFSPIRSVLNFSLRTPVTSNAATICLILHGIFLSVTYFKSTSLSFIPLFFGCAPTRLWSGEYERLLLAPFVHSSYFHLSLNMAALWGIGRFVELRYGSTTMFLVLLFAILGSEFFSVWYESNYHGLQTELFHHGMQGGICGLIGFAITVWLLGVPTFKRLLSDRDLRIQAKILGKKSMVLWMLLRLALWRLMLHGPPESLKAIAQGLFTPILLGWKLYIANIQLSDLSGLGIGAVLGVCYKFGRRAAVLGAGALMSAGIYYGIKHPDNPRFHAWKGLELFSEGKYEEAIPHLEAYKQVMLQYNQVDQWALLFLSLVYSQLPDDGWEKGKQIAGLVNTKEMANSIPEKVELQANTELIAPWVFVRGEYSKQLFEWLRDEPNQASIDGLTQPVIQSSVIGQSLNQEYGRMLLAKLAELMKKNKNEK